MAVPGKVVQVKVVRSPTPSPAEWCEDLQKGVRKAQCDGRGVGTLTFSSILSFLAFL